MARTKAGSLPTYRHHKASNQAIVSIAGSDFYLGAYNTPASKAEYARLIGEYVATGRAPQRARDDTDEPVSVAEVLLGYWKHAQVYYCILGSSSHSETTGR